ncbi:MAG: hypothetical protein OK452_07465 [Thaumarchaeota archaeon]|nr:hypothetical protein [Nitrososphaerota archaeon]
MEQVIQVPMEEGAAITSSNNGNLSNRRNKIQLSEPERLPNVTVKLKRGSWEIEITAQEDRVQQAVESVLAGMASKEQALVQSQETDSDERRFETCRGVIVTMWKEGWFASSRALSEVHEEMSRRGYHYDRTAVSHTLVDLVREGSLFRDGTMRNYRYVQKYPFKG